MTLEEAFCAVQEYNRREKMATKILCDRCGEDVVPIVRSGWTIIPSAKKAVGDSEHTIPRDLCWVCWDKMRAEIDFDVWDERT